MRFGWGPEAEVRAAEARFASASPPQGLHGLILLRHGHRVAQGWWSPYGPHHPHELFSLTKSFTSTAVGLAVAEGRLSVDDRVIDLFPDDAPAQPGRGPMTGPAPDIEALIEMMVQADLALLRQENGL